jgi:hypothetical protein
MNKAIPRKILLSLAVVMLATLVAAPMVLAAGTATRDLPATSVAPSAQFNVGIVASGCGFAGQVRETLPAGFTYVSVSDPVNIAVAVVGQEVRFTFMGASADFSYTVQATATAGTYTFAGVVLDQNQTPSTVGGDTPVTVGAAGTYTLTIAVTGSGTTTPAVGTHTYAAGTDVTLTANPIAGWEFSHWSGTNNNAINPTTVTMNANKTVTATFEESVTPQTFAWWLYETYIEPFM